MTRIIAALLLCCSVLPALADDTGTLIRLEHEWLAASAKGDRQVLERLLHPQFVDVTASGRMRTRGEVLMAPPLPASMTQALQNVNVRILGKTAVVTGVNVVRSGPTALPLEIVFTDVYVREGRQWRAVSAHHTARRRQATQPESGAAQP